MLKQPHTHTECPLLDDTAHVSLKKSIETFDDCSLHFGTFSLDPEPVHEVQLGNHKGRAVGLIGHDNLKELHSQLGEYLDNFEKTSKK